MSGDQKIVLGYPVDLKQCSEEDQRLYAAALAGGRSMVYYPGSVVRPCARCGIDIFVGPRSQEVLSAYPGVPSMCMICGVRFANEVQATLDLRTLGNTHYYMRTY